MSLLNEHVKYTFDSAKHVLEKNKTEVQLMIMVFVLKVLLIMEIHEWLQVLK